MLQPDKLKKLNENAALMAAQGKSKEEILAMKDAFIKQFGIEEPLKKKDSSASIEQQGPQADTMASPSEDGLSVTPLISNKKFGLTPQDLKDIGKKQPTDMSGKPLLPEVNAKLMKSIAERPKPLEKIEKQKSYMENMGTSLISGLNDVNKMIASIPETIYNLASIPQNAVAYVTGLDISTNADKYKKNMGITNPILDYYKEEGKKLEEETAKFNEQNYKSSSIYQNIEDGNYQDAFELLGTGIVRSAPTSIAIMTGGATMSAAELATVSTAAFYDQNLEQLQGENPDASDIENNIKALGMSAAESVFSSIGQGQIGAVYRDIIRKEGVEVGQKVFKDGLIEMYKVALKKYGVPVGLMGEGIEESATQITQNMISGKPAFEGAADAFILGGGSGVMFTAPMSLKNANDRINNKVKEIEDKKQINLILDGSTDGLNKIFDVAKDSEINEKQLSIASLGKSRELLVKELDRGVKKGEITKDQAKQSLYVFDKTKQITGQLRDIDIDNESKVKVANLLKERESLSQKIQGKDEALSVLEKQRIAEINEEIKQTILNPKETASEYIINEKKYSKEEFLKELEGKTPDELKTMKIVVNNDEQTAKNINEKFKANAIQKQTTDESVLRTEQPEVGLQEVGEGDTQTEVITEQATQEVTPSETITTEQEEVVTPTEVKPIDNVFSEVDSFNKTNRPLEFKSQRDYEFEYDRARDKEYQAKRNIAQADDTDAAIKEYEAIKKEREDLENEKEKEKTYKTITSIIYDTVDDSKKPDYQYKELFDKDPRLAAIEDYKDLTVFLEQDFPEKTESIDRYKNNIKILEEDIKNFPLKENTFLREEVVPDEAPTEVAPTEKIKGGDILNPNYFLNDKQLTFQEGFDLANSELKELESQERTLAVQREIEAKVKEINRTKEQASKASETTAEIAPVEKSPIDIQESRVKSAQSLLDEAKTKAAKKKAMTDLVAEQGRLAEMKALEKVKAEVAPAEVDKIKSDIDASKERLKKAWDEYKTMGIAFDPKNNLARDKELVNSLIEYAYNNIRLGSYEASKLIKDLAEQGFEITKDGAKFIIDKATQKIATEDAKAEIKDLKGQVVDVFKAGIEAVKIAETTAKEKARNIKTKAQELAKYLDNLKGKGKITSTQAAVIVKRFSKVNVLSEKSVNRFIDYATKVLNDANYNTKLNEARKTLSSLKKLSKNAEKNADLRALGSEFVKIDPSMVENIDEYNDIANKIKTALEGSKTRKSTTNFADTVNIDDTIAYTEEILAEQEIKSRAEKITELQNLLDVDASTFSAEEIDTLFDIYGEEKSSSAIKDNAKIIRAAVNKAFNIYSTVINEMLSTGVDPFTEEDVEFTDAQKKIIRDFMAIDLDTVEDNKEALRIIDSLINFIQNKSTAGMLKPIADFKGIEGGVEAEKQGFKAQKLRKYWIPKLGKALSKAFTTTPVLLEKMFKGVTRALEFEELIGLSDLINNSSKSQSDVNMIVKEYVKDFYKRKANGESYNSAYNDVERGVLAHMSRNVIGIESRMKKVFDKRKQEVLDTIELLSSKGNDSEQEIAKLIKKAYDKILDGSENIKDVRLKTDINNVEGVNYWVNQWNSRYEALSDLALNFYNKILGRDLGYTPDRIIKLQDKRGDVELEDIDSQFFANTDEILYDKKSGSLMDKQEDRKIPKDMYIDFSFDKKNANAMNDALTDLYTAFDIRRVGAFLKSDSFRKIFKSSAEANLVDKRIKKFVRITRKKTPYSNDEISDFLKGADRLAKLGVTMSLASVKQPFIQTIPVMVSTAINAGSVGIGAAFDPKFNAWLNELGYAISNRGVESQAQLESMNKLLEKAADMPLDKAFKFVEKVQDESLKLLLVKGDVAVARASFKAYYEQSLKRQGEKLNNIDYSNHEVNKKAANYAQRMVDRQQNISNQALAGDLYTSESDGTKIFIKMLMPFSSFRMNQASRLSSDLGTLEYWNTSTKEDKIIALRSIAGYAAESATYRGLQIGTAMLFSSLASLIMGGDDEEEEKKYKENLITGAAQGMFIDTFSPVPLADPFTQDALAYSVDEIQNLIDITEDKKIKLFGSKDQSMLKVFGTLGIPIEKTKDIIMLGKLAYTKKYTDKYGNKKEISQDDADKLKTLIAPLIVFTSVGFGSPDMSAIVRRSKKIAEKGSGKSGNLRTVKAGDEFK